MASVEAGGAGAPRTGACLAEIAWLEVAPRLASGAVAVLPVGAAAKEHGPHLPMNTDWLQAEAFGRALAERANVLVWPTVGYGHYPAFVDYPGSTSLDAATFEAVLTQLLASITRAGASRVLVLDTGISTIAPVDAACASSAIAGAAHVYRGEGYLAARAALVRQPRGGHADEAETSIMLHLHPELVRLERAATWVEPMPAGRWSPSDPASPRYSPSGVYGDATLATPELGARLVEAILGDLERTLAAG